MVNDDMATCNVRSLNDEYTGNHLMPVYQIIDDRPFLLIFF